MMITGICTSFIPLKYTAPRRQQRWEAILQRVVALPEAAHQLLRLASVVGRRVPRPVLVEMAARLGLAVEAMPEALEACGRAKLLVETGEDAYQFAHDLIREVVLADLGAVRRALFHRYVAEALERGPGAPPIEALAFHYARSGEAEKAVIYLERAGDGARAHYAHAEATEAYREVVTRLEALGRSEEAARVREKLGETLNLQTRYDEALAVLDQAGETYRQTGNLEGELRSLAQVGRIHRWRGTSKEGLARLLPLLERLPANEPLRGAAAYYVALAHLFIGVGQYREQLDAERAVALARATNDEQTLIAAQERQAAALLMLGRLDEMRQALTEDVIPASKASGNMRTLITSLDNLAAAYE